MHFTFPSRTVSTFCREFFMCLSSTTIDRSEYFSSFFLHLLRLLPLTCDRHITNKSYLNFGGIGFVIGHEMTHGFDDLGKEFDKYGNYRNWWDEMTNKRFRNKTRCIIDQYNEYKTKNGLKVNGVLTQGENIADNGGAKEAFKVTWIETNRIMQFPPNQPDFAFSSFFLAKRRLTNSGLKIMAKKLRCLASISRPNNCFS